jgi:hypothetical protein
VLMTPWSPCLIVRPCFGVQGMEVAIKTAMEGLDPDNVHAMAVSGQQHGLVAVDSDGKVCPSAETAAHAPYVRSRLLLRGLHGNNCK